MEDGPVRHDDVRNLRHRTATGGSLSRKWRRGAARSVAGTDANGDGKLSAEELAAQDMRMMQQMATARATMRVERLDVDGDGLLSVEELAARPMPEMMFERLDADGDGAVTEEEAEAARAQMGERRGGDDGDGPRGHRKHFWMNGGN